MEDARLPVPDGGIASFVSADDEDEYEGGEDYGSEGIATFSEVAARMAAKGRGGDTVLGHLTPGELVIPKDLIDKDPALKEGLFQRLRDMGVEDPERYVVGSDANSINPETGQPEFFKFLKKIFKGIKKIVQGVVKVIKKIAPIVLPIVGSIVLGPIYGAALGSGVATLINGGSFKDALKSAAIGGITGGIGAGVSGMASGVGFAGGVKAALNPANISAGIGAVKTGFTEGFKESGLGWQSAKFGVAGGQQVADQLAAQAAASSLTPTVSSSGSGASPATAAAQGGDLVAPSQAATEAIRPATFGENIRDAFTPGGKSFGQSMSDAFFPKAAPVDTVAVGNAAYTNAYNNAMNLPGMSSEAASQIGRVAMTDAIKNATAAAAPSFLAKYGPLALAGTALASSTGMFDPVPAEPAGVVQRDPETGDVVTGTDLVEQNPDDYLVSDIDPNRPVAYPDFVLGDLNPTRGDRGSYGVPTNFGTIITLPPLIASEPGGPFARPGIRRAAEGGAIFPRRNGGIMPNEGIPGQDSVRAMLMPGEFVMTTDAVRGFGNGDLNRGIRNMYSVMRNLESRGKAMA